MKQEACPLFSEAPVTVIVPLPGVAVTAPAPLGQLVARLGTVATTTFAGSVSVKLMPDCDGLKRPFVSENVSVAVEPWSMFAGKKDLLRLARRKLIAWSVTPFSRLPSADICGAPLV